jgi:ubiquinone/menaquinone biosynthesis C-methylase UbiE
LKAWVNTSRFCLQTLAQSAWHLGSHGSELNPANWCTCRGEESVSYILMRVLESTPTRYDRGIHLLTLGQVARGYDRLTAWIEPGWRVLDLGTGTGALALRAAARGAEVVALDVNPAMLAVARRKGEAAGLGDRITWQEMGVAELDGLPGAFDAICAGLCFSELTPDERRYALSQGQRLLRPGGLLLLADEIRPRRLHQRVLHGCLRAPLAAFTWLLTQTSTHAVLDLPGLVRAAGFEMIEMRTSLMGSWAEVVARQAGPRRRETDGAGTKNTRKSLPAPALQAGAAKSKDTRSSC